VPPNQRGLQGVQSDLTAKQFVGVILPFARTRDALIDTPYARRSAMPRLVIAR